MLGVLVLAFAPFERRPLVGAVELFRGFAVQLAYRWGAGQVLAEPANRAVLLWSVTGFRITTRRAGRELCGVGLAVGIGVTLFAASNALLLLAVNGLLTLFLVRQDWRLGGCLGLVLVRLALTGWRAVQAYRQQAAISAELPAPLGTRWRVDYLAAIPARKGHGGALLDDFLTLADTQDAEVVLHCDSSGLTFYRHHGFRLAGSHRAGQRLMIRPAAHARSGPPRAAVPITGKNTTHRRKPR